METTKKILSFEQEFIRKHPDRIQILTYLRKAIGKKEINWDDITTLNLSRFREYVTSKVAGNSACTYFAILKAFLNHYKDEEIMPCKTPKNELRAKHLPSQNVFLTEEEIKRIEEYEPQTDVESDVKHAFLIECYLGARRSDVLKITPENISENVIRYISQKTKIEVTVPIHKCLLEHLQYKPKKERALMVYNRAIQDICKKCGITKKYRLFYHGKMQKRPKYEFVGSHTARRSFCTNLARRGVDIYTIAALAGHGQNVVMTQRYIVNQTETLPEDAMRFFG